MLLVPLGIARTSLSPAPASASASPPPLPAPHPVLPFLLQLVCEDVNVDRFYPVLYPKVRLIAGLGEPLGEGVFGPLPSALYFSQVISLTLT